VAAESGNSKLPLTKAANSGIKAVAGMLDPQVLLVVSLNPEVRIKVGRGPAKACCSKGFTPVLIKSQRQQRWQIR